MKRSNAARTPSLVVDRHEPVIATPLIENGREVVRYSVEPAETEAIDPSILPYSVRGALKLAGVWSDIDWCETVEALERIRHESQPTPPIGSLDL